MSEYRSDRFFASEESDEEFICQHIFSVAF